jgi:hypothetical protein
MPTRCFSRTPPTQASVSSKVHPDPPTYSARVGIGYQAVGVVDADTVIWFQIGSHADYHKLLKQL